MSEEADPGSVAEAARVLAALELVTAFGHVSARAGGTVLITPAADLSTVTGDQVLNVPGDTAELRPPAPAEGWVHLAVYRTRPDVHAVARAQPAAALPVGVLDHELRPVHGQAAWLGRRVPVHPGAELLRSPELGRAAAMRMGDADAMVLRGNGAVTTGSTPGEAVARMWLLEQACLVRAGVRGHAVSELTDAEIDAWRAAAPSLLHRLWEHLRRRTSSLVIPAGHEASTP